MIPACEDLDVTDNLSRILRGSSTEFLFDPASYRLSRSKIESNAMMEEAGIPLPGKWPECGFPAIVKPSSQSGSVGVTAALSDADIQRGLGTVRSLGDEPVIQEFVSGRSVSVEVIGNGHRWEGYVTTEVVLDGGYDCKEVRCNPGILSPEDDALLRGIGTRMAERMGLS